MRRDYEIKNIRRDWDRSSLSRYPICVRGMEHGRKWSSLFHANDRRHSYFSTSGRRPRACSRYEICTAVTSTRPPRKGQKTDTASSRHAPALILVSHPRSIFFSFNPISDRPIHPSTRTIHSFIHSSWKKWIFESIPPYSEKFTKMSTNRGKFLHSIRYFSIFQK